ncbi:MAG: nucleotidyl transferase AbiEii/AbiGii toxin family protein [candidate division WOR-3 bacterium]
MNNQFKAIKEVHDFFTKEGIPYVFIGGIALQFWGEPRFTRDIDLTIRVELGKEEEIIKKILQNFAPRISDAFKFALKNRICLVKSKGDYEIDISLGIPGYEDIIMKRAVNLELEKGYIIRICSAEDLIIQKAIASRARDIEDIEGIILRQGKKLNIRYIRRWLKKFSEILSMPEILEGFEKIYKNTTFRT